MRVLVTGGAGYIGSVVVQELLAQGNTVVVYDNLSKGHADAVDDPALLVQGDLNDKETLRGVMQTHGIEAVIHLAASSQVGESVLDPAKYYRENVVGSLSLLGTMTECGVNRLVFSSTAAVYGEPVGDTIKESDPLVPINPYGETKLTFERALPSYEAAYGIRFASLRYFNAAGATLKHGERHDPETHLIPLVLETARAGGPPVQIFGNDYPTPDGTCVRDYIHVTDLARAHILALESLEQGSGIYNLGCGGEGYSVLDVVETAKAVTGCEIPTRLADRRPGDPARLVASSDRARTQLGWKPMFQDLRMIIDSAWNWKQKATGESN